MSSARYDIEYIYDTYKQLSREAKTLSNCSEASGLLLIIVASSRATRKQIDDDDGGGATLK